MSGPSPFMTRRWMVCGLLLLASAINYMDRQTLANAAVRVTREFQLNQEQYGIVESAFGYAFAAGSLVFGVLADKVPLRWLYPLVVLLWSAVGFATGFTGSYGQLLFCRTLLGFFEGGHWPCGVKATRALLDARDRSLGNSVLQSGTSIGAIITPLIMRAMMTDELGTWRYPFQAIGAVGILWIVLWFGLARKSDLDGMPEPVPLARGPEPSLWSLLLSRRMLVVFVVIACINTTWQILRAWLPKILQEGRGWSETAALYFNSAWFAATDVGCLGAGVLAVWLARRGQTVDRARLIVFGGCAALCALIALAPWLGTGWLLSAVLMIAGAGALGLFPIYHAFTQDISGRHQGRITGIAGVAAWLAPAPAQRLFGFVADRTGSFDAGLVMAAFLPIIAWLTLALGWGRQSPSKSMNAANLSRRAFLGALAVPALGAAAGPDSSARRRRYALAVPTLAGAADPPRGARKKIALLGTVVTRHSHSQHFFDRFLLGYGWRGEWRRPEVDVASLFIDQFPEDDLGRAPREGIQRPDLSERARSALPWRDEARGRWRGDHRRTRQLPEERTRPAALPATRVVQGDR